MAILEPTLSDAIDGHIRGAANNFGVATAGIVMKVKNVGNVTVTITAKPAVHKLVESEDDEDIDDVEEYPALQEVPVLWPQGRGVRIKGQLQVGDPVLLVCLDRDISGWRRSGSLSEPEDVRIHDWSNAIAIPGLVPDTSPFTEPTDSAALASKLDALIGILTGWTPVPNDGGAALKVAVSTAFPSIPINPAPGPFYISSTGSVRLKLDG